ncbi:MAG: tRNA-specific 2-thiouridylase [Lachnospiraceae bacterium]|nr:tRNA-specific 2-thiouridylase [Lachnospiraceae bacterium]
MAKVVVGMSGGVDSAVAAYLLKEAGHEVIGVTLRTWESDDGSLSRCCEINDAQAAAWKIGIDFHSFNCLREFREKVTEPFICDYIRGLTPNPCIECNRFVKWEKLLHAARVLEADFVATGHYAYVVKLPNGRFSVKRAKYAQKDQTYMLYKLTQEQLSKTLMPLGDYSKDEVREIARKIGLDVAEKPDSQEICFVPDDDYAGFIIKNVAVVNEGANSICMSEKENETAFYDRQPREKDVGESGKPEASGVKCKAFSEGNFVDSDGNILGKHKGIIHYTVGQRRGLGLPLGYYAYVSEIRPDTNEVVVGKEDSIMHKSIICRDVNYVGLPAMKSGETAELFVKIRYHHEAKLAVVEALEEGRVKVIFEEAVRAPAPGQSAVFYDGDGCVAGGGIIEAAI